MEQQKPPNPFLDLVYSKKFIAAMLGLIIAVGSRYVPGLQDMQIDELATLLSPILIYIIGQGMADFGKKCQMSEPVTPKPGDTPLPRKAAEAGWRVTPGDVARALSEWKRRVPGFERRLAEAAGNGN